MRLKLSVLFSFLIVLSLIVAACGGGAEPTAAPPAAPAQEEAAEEPAEEPAEEAAEEPTEEPAEEPAAAGPLECTDDLGCVELAPDEPIHIAYMLTVSGATANLGQDSRGAIEIAIDDRGGELLGHPIQLSGEDTLCSAEGGQTGAQRVAADPTILGVVGTSCSSEAVAALPVISQAGLVMISPSNTAPILTSDDAAAGGVWQPGYFRTAHNDLFQGRIAAEFMYNELGARTLATIHDGSPYADGLQAVAAEVFQELGGEVTFQGAVNVGDTDMRPILTEIAANPPDVLYFPIFEPEGNFIAAQSQEIAGLEEMILFGADGLFADTFPENTGESVVGMYLSGPFVAGEAYDAFLAKWEEKFGGSPPSGFHAHAYDAANILLNAIESVAQQGEDGALLVGRQALRDAVAATSGFSGLTGTLSCQPTGDCATGEALAVFQLTEAEVNEGNWPPEAIWQP
ncbi:MAG: branched-chain amino acid ABC transporter substrate-binding protein [Chloroflexi bacterium]|nr:MAG: branched-chain amino acid ABC transporter substrate-binding protein [Chloroflexota bacterium]